MNRLRVSALALVAAASVTLAGCVTDDYGYGGGYVESSYGGYSGDPYYGWQDDFYYPGTGYYVYDRGGRRHSWNDTQRRHWEARRGNNARREGRPNWSGYRGTRPADQGQYGGRQRRNWNSEQNSGVDRAPRPQRQRSDRGGRNAPSAVPSQPQAQPQQQEQAPARLYLPPSTN